MSPIKLITNYVTQLMYSKINFKYILIMCRVQNVTTLMLMSCACVLNILAVVIIVRYCSSLYFNFVLVSRFWCCLTSLSFDKSLLLSSEVWLLIVVEIAEISYTIVIWDIWLVLSPSTHMYTCTLKSNDSEFLIIHISWQLILDGTIAFISSADSVILLCPCVYFSLIKKYIPNMWDAEEYMLSCCTVWFQKQKKFETIPTYTILNKYGRDS